MLLLYSLLFLGPKGFPGQGVNIVGPKGPKGLRGRPGLPGITGRDGSNGFNGLKGLKGDTCIPAQSKYMLAVMER